MAVNLADHDRCRDRVLVLDLDRVPFPDHVPGLVPFPDHAPDQGLVHCPGRAPDQGPALFPSHAPGRVPGLGLALALVPGLALFQGLALVPGHGHRGHSIAGARLGRDPDLTVEDRDLTTAGVLMIREAVALMIHVQTEVTGGLTVVMTVV